MWEGLFCVSGESAAESLPSARALVAPSMVPPPHWTLGVRLISSGLLEPRCPKACGGDAIDEAAFAACHLSLPSTSQLCHDKPPRRRRHRIRV